MGIIDSAINAAVTTTINSKNKAYQDRVNRQIWAREDTAVQRRVRDLKKAGLSPVLAAGSAAGSGGTVSAAHMEAPQIDDPVAGGMALMQQEADIARTVAQKELLEAQKEGQDIQNEEEDIELGNTKEGGGKPQTFVGRMLRDVRNSSKTRDAAIKLQEKLEAAKNKRREALQKEFERKQMNLPFFEQKVK